MINNSSKTEYSVALGYFDGLHIGHKAVISAAKEKAENGLCPAVLLFDEHPKKVISGKNVPFLLQKDIRERMLTENGVRPLYLSFAHIKELSPEEFVSHILIEKLGAGAVSCGFNYRFGKNGRGDAKLLKEICEKNGIEVSIVSEVLLDGEEVNSTKIRKAVENGEIEKANKMLGFPFVFSSEIFTGDRRGRLLGAPTINQFLPEGLIIPSFGVYAAKVFFDGNEYIGVANVGSRPTFDGVSVRSETYIIGYSGNLYGKNVEVELYKFIRKEKKFPDADSLKAQIASDIRATEQYFAEINK